MVGVAVGGKEVAWEEEGGPGLVVEVASPAGQVGRLTVRTGGPVRKEPGCT